VKAAVLACLVLTGCGYEATHETTDPTGQIIGTSIANIIPCAGLPDKTQRLLPDAAIAQWSYKDDSSPLKLTLSLVGSVSIGSAGSCKMTLTFLRDGTVVDAAFPQCAGTLEGGPYAAARPLISECLRHPNDISLPAGYDAFINLGVK
jgi:hypothetical protein